MKSLRLCLALIFVSFFSVKGEGQYPVFEANTRAALAKPLEIRVQITLLREQEQPVAAAEARKKLRDLPNVLLVSEKPDFVLLLMGQYADRTYVCPSIALSPKNDWIVDRVGNSITWQLTETGSGKVSPVYDMMKKEMEHVDPVYSVEYYGTTSNPDIGAALDRAIKTFDSKCLEPRRQSDQRMKDRFRQDLKDLQK